MLQSPPLIRMLSGALLLLASSVQGAPAPLRFSISESWTMPLIQLDHHQPTQGILYDLMQSLAEHMQRPAHFQTYPSARLKTAMAHDEIDVRCLVTPAWLPEQQDRARWSAPVMTLRDVLISAAPAPELATLPTLAQQRIGTVLGYTYPSLQPRFDSGQFKRDDARNQELVMRKLLAGRFDYAVGNQWTMDWTNRSLPADKQLRAIALVEEQPVSCLVRNDPALPVQEILDTLQQMQASGEIERIIERYVERP